MRYVVMTKHDYEEQEWDRRTFRTLQRKQIVWACHQAKLGIQYRSTNSEGASINDAKAFYKGRPDTLMEWNRSGGVCGAQSFYTVGVCQSHGIPAFPVALPGYTTTTVRLESVLFPIDEFDGHLGALLVLFIRIFKPDSMLSFNVGTVLYDSRSSRTVEALQPR